MSMMVPNNLYHLVDKVLDEGLGFIAEYVEGLLKHPVLITDHNGRIHYPEEASSSSELDDVFAFIPPNLSGRDFYYDPDKRSLYYRVRYNSSSAFIIAKEVPVEQIAQALSILTETKLAVKCHFSKLHTDSEHFEQELAEYLFGNSNANIRDIAKLSDTRLEMDRSYFVTLMETEKVPNETEMQMIRSYLYEYLKNNKFKAVPISWSNKITMIVAVCAKDGLEEVFNWPAMINYKKVLEGRFKLPLSQGIGGVYPLADLRRSFYEARIALTLPKLLGKTCFVEKFSDLGLYYLIFSQNLKNIKNFCLQTLGKIIEHDEKTEGELLPTLRKLLDSNVNMKSTADSLFIHVNTLYYRVNKIEELLEIDFSNMNCRANLFIAIKVWDTLLINGLVMD